MSKRLLAVFLVLVMILSLTACGGEEEEQTSKRRRKDKETETTGEVTEVVDNTKPGKEEKPERGKGYKSPYTEFEEMDDTVIIDDEYVTVTLGKPSVEDWFLEFDMEVVNKSDRSLAVYTEYTAVNGKMTQDGAYVAVEPNKAASEKGHIYDITDFDDVTRFSMAVQIYDTFEYDLDKFYYIDIFPHGKDAYEPEKAPKELDSLVEEDEFYAATTDFYVDDYGDYRTDGVIGNYSDELVRFTHNIVTVNGFGMNSMMYGYVLPGTFAETTNYLDMEYLKALGIKDVTGLEVDCAFEDMDYDTIVENTVTVYPEGKSKYEEFLFEFDDKCIIAVEEKDFSMALTNITYDEEYGIKIYFVLKNETGKSLSFNGTNLVVNGKKLEYNGMYTSCYRPVDTFGVISIYEPETLGIDEIESVQMDLEILDEDYDTVFEETVTFAF